MAETTVEATLSSKYEDGVEAGLRRTQRTAERTFAAMNRAAGVLRTGAALAFGAVVAGAALAAVVALRLARAIPQIAVQMIDVSSKALKLKSDLTSVRDVVDSSESAWRRLLQQYGVAIQRGGVLQELFRRITERLDATVASEERLNEVTLESNRILLDTLRTFGQLARATGLLSTAVQFLGAFMVSAMNALITVLTAVGFAAVATLSVIVEAFSKLPGAVGRSVDGVLESLREFETLLLRVSAGAGNATVDAFKGVDDGRQQLNAFADQIDALAAELSKYERVVRDSGTATTDFNLETKNSEAALRELKRQLREVAQIEGELSSRGVDDFTRIQLRLQSDIDRINSLAILSEGRRNQLIILAREAFVRDFNQLVEREQATKQSKAEADARLAEREVREQERLIELRRRTDDVVASSAATAESAVFRQINAWNLLITKLPEISAKTLEFTNLVSTAWGNLFADLVSGQQNAFGKLLASLVNFVAREAQAFAKRLAIRALFHAAVGNFGQAARAGAAAAAIAAIAGALKGAAANAAGTSQGGAAGRTFQTNVPRPVEPTVRRSPIDVGSSGGSSNLGEARQVVELRIAPQDAFVVDAVERNIVSNGRLRVVVARA